MTQKIPKPLNKTKLSSKTQIVVHKKMTQRAAISVEPFSHAPKNDSNQSMQILDSLNSTLQGDIYDHKLIKKNFRESAEYFRVFMEQVNDAIFVCDPRGKILVVNPYGCRMFGYEMDEFLGKTIQETYLPEDFEIAEARMQQLGDGIASRFERKARRKDGSVFEIESSVTKMSNGLLYGIIRDISQQKLTEQQRTQTEKALQQNEERTRQILSLMPAGVYSCDAEGRITFYNRRAVELWGCEPKLNSEPQKFCGCFKVWLPDGTFLPPEKTPMAIAIEHKQSFRNIEAIVERADGSKFYASVNIDPIIDDKGQVTGAINVFQDISERKRAQETLRESTQRYRAFVSQSSEGIWRFEVKQAIPIDLPVEEQIDRIFKDAYLAECNDALAKMYGYEVAQEITGKPLADFLPRADKRNIEYLKAFIESGYRLIEAESHKLNKDGKPVVFLNNLIGIIENGKLIRAWGMQRDITDRKNAEQERRCLAAIVECSDDAIVGKDQNGIITSFNHGAQKIFGYRAEEVVGKHVSMLLPADCADEFPALMQRLRQGEKIAHYDTVRRRKDGTLIDVSVTVSPIFDDQGELVGASKVARDITWSKSLLNKLQESEDRFRTLTNHAPVGIFMANLRGDCLFVNQSWCSMAGLTEEEAKGPGWTQALHPDDRQHVAEEWDQAIQQNKPFTSEYRFIHKNGTVIWLQGSAVELKNADGSILGYIGTVVDITARKQSEEIIRERETRFRILADNAPVLIWVNGIEGCEFVNSKYLEFLGVEDNNVHGYDWANFIHPEDRKEYLDAYHKALANRKVFDAQFRFRRHDGEYRWMKTVGVPRFAENGDFVGCVGTTTDITESKNAEDKIRESEIRYRQLVQSLPAAVYTCDAQGRIILFNESAAILWGRSPKIGEEWWSGSYKIFNPDGSPLALEECPMAVSLREGRSIRDREIVIERPDGTRRNILPHPEPIFDSSGNLLGAINMLVDITERKEAEQALRDSEERFRLATDAGMVGTWDLDVKANKVTWSKQIYEFHGLKKGEFDETIQGFSKLVYPEDRERVEAAIKNSLETLVPYSIEMRVVRPGGEVRWISTNGRVIAGHDGKAIRMLGATIDITDIRRAQENLYQQTRSLTIINSIGKTLAAELDLNKLVQAVTDAGCEVSGAEFGAFFYTVKNDAGEGYTLYTLSGAPREAFEKFGQPRITALFRPTFEGQGIVRVGDILKDPRYGKMGPHYGMPKEHLPVRSYMALPVISRSGEVFGGLLFGHPKPDIFTEQSEKILVGIAAQAAVAIDNANLYQAVQKELSEHKRTEEALRQSEEHFRHLADSMPQIVWTADANGRTDYFNKRWYEFTGLSTGAIADEYWTSVLHPDDIERCLSLWSAAVKTGNRYEIEYRFKNHQSGGYRWFLGRGTPIKNEEGKILRWYGTCTDIEEQKKDQDKLLKIADELSQSNRELEQFAYIASHDLQEPLHMINSFVDLLALRCADKLENKEKEYLDFIKHGSIQAKTLIHELLEYSRIGKGNPHKLVDLQSVVEEVESNLKLSITQAAAQIQCGVLPTIKASHLEMVQLLQNLISNAIKYRSAKAPYIEISCSRINDMWKFCIKDNGIGIEPEYRERIFGMFQRLHSKDQYSGTGIGLAVCKKIVEYHGGDIWVESEPGMGSSFYFTINIVEGNGA